MRLRRILASLVVVAVAGGAAYLGTSAFFSDTETSTGNVLSAGSIDLTVNGNFASTANGSTGTFEFPKGSINGLFAFQDLKPGDTGGGNVEISATSNPYYACIGITDLVNSENSVTDPEVDANDPGGDTGELDQFVYIAVWNDSDGNGEYNGEIQVSGSPFLLNSAQVTPWLPLSDSVGGVFGQGPLNTVDTYNIGMKYCFGTFDEDLECTPAGNESNIAQTDSVEGAMKFYAVQSRNNTDFLCSSLNQNGEEPFSQTFSIESVRVNSLGSHDGSQYQVGRTLELESIYGANSEFELTISENGDDFEFVLVTPFEIGGPTDVNDSASVLFDSDNDGTADFQYEFVGVSTWKYKTSDGSGWTEVSPAPSVFSATVSDGETTFTVVIPKSEFGGTFRVAANATDNGSLAAGTHLGMSIPEGDVFNGGANNWTSSDNYQTVTP